jgi:hypothetical protein
MNETLAPCVAIVGPANSGKTTFLHLLDRALQQHPSRMLAYVVKGSPDGSGRYQFYNPKLREELKSHVKGAWNGNPTIEQICNWTLNTRRHVDLALLDFGGKHDPENQRMLSRCTHFIVVAREFDDPEEEARKGMDSWRRACVEAGLQPLALISSEWQRGEVVARVEADLLIGTMRADAQRPEDTINQPLIDAVRDRLLALRLPGREPGYVNLNIGRWNPSAVDADLQPLVARLQHLARSQAPVRLGGVAPVFAYLRAMHVALDENPDTEVEVFDPKLGFVSIPRRCLRADGFPSVLQFEVDEPSAYCEVTIATVDRMLPFSAAEWLAFAPPPPVEGMGKRVTMSGPLPIWLQATFSRWLRESKEEIAIWDAGSGTPITVQTTKARTVEGERSPERGEAIR